MKISDTGNVRLSELVGGQNSPGRLLVLESDMIFELAEEATKEYKNLNVNNNASRCRSSIDIS